MRQNSFDPREVTQSINSEGGLTRRFDWGNLSVSANRRQFLSDDRVEMTLPSANLSLKSITLFRAPSNRARFFNNMTWSGSANYRRSTVDRAAQAESTFMRSLADEVRTSSGVSSALNLGGLSWTQALSLTEKANLDLPAAIAFPGDTLGPPPTGLVDLAGADLTWTTSLNYQQRLIGSTTLTPSLQVSGAAKRSDEIPEAPSFVFGPRRLSFGARLKSDIYGYYGGFAGFEAIRHKISPSFSYAYSPKTTATDLQEAVFGASNAFTRNIVTFGFNQVFEAKRAEGDVGGTEDDGLDLDEDLLAPDSIRDARADSLLALEEAPPEPVADDELDPDGPRRLPPSRVINLLSLNTSVVTYDFVRARKSDNPLDGFTTTRLRSQISSGLLRGFPAFGRTRSLRQRGSERRGSPDLRSTTVSSEFFLRDESQLWGSPGHRPAFSAAGGDASSGAAGATEADWVAALMDTDDLDPLLDNVGNLSPTDESSIIPGAGSNDVVGEDPQGVARRQSGRRLEY